MQGLVNSAVSNTGARTSHETDSAGPKIVCIGCGGGGSNSVNRISRMGVSGAELIAINTDKLHLRLVNDNVKKIMIGQSITRGLGAGGYPEIGEKSAEASRAELNSALENADLVFLTAGMGGGTGTGSAPIVADIAKQQGAIVVAIVTYPFLMERARMVKADQGIEKLKKVADTVIIIDNNRLVELVPNLPIEQAFSVADEIIARAVKGITETITIPSLINLDYADVRSIMTGGGVSVISVGEAKGNNRVQEAVNSTLKNSLLDVDYRGAKGVLIHVTGGPDLTLGEVNEIGQGLTDAIDPNATVIWGSRVLPEYEGMVEVIGIFTGVHSAHIKGAAASAASDNEKKHAAEQEIDLNYVF
ncbi:MAG: cell division protein FtsZ [Candidatus Diapherotrites archaeon]|nr:cell division protein FtsZ [Candidatus Diapherotrites archaeon]